MRIQLNLCLDVSPHFHINITKAVFGKNYYDERKGLDKLEVAILHYKQHSAKFLESRRRHQPHQNQIEF